MRAVPMKNDVRENLIHHYFAQSGCNGDQLREQAVKHEKIPNLICTMPESERNILVGAHSDCVSAGSGAVDNGVALCCYPAFTQA